MKALLLIISIAGLTVSAYAHKASKYSVSLNYDCKSINKTKAKIDAELSKKHIKNLEEALQIASSVASKANCTIIGIEKEVTPPRPDSTGNN